MTSPSRSPSTVPKPEPSDGQVLVRIEACGLCHIDIHAAQGDWPIKPPLPLIRATSGWGSSRRSDPAPVTRSAWATGS